LLSLVIPTFNERANLGTLVRRIHESLGAYPFELIVVDDDSPDGTGREAEELARTYPLQVVHRRGKRELGTAVVEGLGRARGTVLGFMDADLSHPPESLPLLLQTLAQDGTDVVIGSRFVEGGRVSEEWSSVRRLASLCARFLCLPLTPVRDSTSGFFLFRREVIQGVDLRPRGYKIGLELLVKGRYALVREVPILFQERRSGASKMTLRVQVDYLLHLAALYGHRLSSRRRRSQGLDPRGMKR